MIEEMGLVEGNSVPKPTSDDNRDQGFIIYKPSPQSCKNRILMHRVICTQKNLGIIVGVYIVTFLFEIGNAA